MASLGGALQPTARGVMLVPERARPAAKRVLVPPKPKTVPPPPPPPPPPSKTKAAAPTAKSKKPRTAAAKSAPAPAAARPPPGMVAVPGRAHAPPLRPAGATGTSSLLVPQYGAGRGKLIVPASAARGVVRPPPPPKTVPPPPKPQPRQQHKKKEDAVRKPTATPGAKLRAQVVDIGALRAAAGKRVPAPRAAGAGAGAGTARYGEGTGRLVMPDRRVAAPPPAKRAHTQDTRRRVVSDSDDDDDRRAGRGSSRDSGPYYDDEEEEDEDEDDDMDGFVVDDEEDEDERIRQDVAREVARLAWGNENRLARHRAAERRGRMYDREDGGRVEEVRGRAALDAEEAATRRRARTLERLQDLAEQGIDVAKYLKKLSAGEAAGKTGKKKSQ